MITYHQLLDSTIQGIWRWLDLELQQGNNFIRGSKWWSVSGTSVVWTEMWTGTPSGGSKDCIHYYSSFPHFWLLPAGIGTMHESLNSAQCNIHSWWDEMECSCLKIWWLVQIMACMHSVIYNDILTESHAHTCMLEFIHACWTPCVYFAYRYCQLVYRYCQLVYRYCQLVYRYCQLVYRYCQLVYRYCQLVYRYCQLVYRYCQLVYRYCQLVYRYCQLVYRYCQLVYRYCQLVYRYCQLACNNQVVVMRLVLEGLSWSYTGKVDH